MGAWKNQVSRNSDSSKAAAARGDFYVEDGCCFTYRVPQAIAPEVVGGTEEELTSCYWIRRAESPEEVAISICEKKTRDSSLRNSLNPSG